MSAAEMARAEEIIRSLLELIDRKLLQIVWLENDSRAVTDARAFLRESER
ncbi:MAG: hypothetical protein ACRDQB_00090 [Thermocrispum sp.]